MPLTYLDATATVRVLIDLQRDIIGLAAEAYATTAAAFAGKPT
jgi:hypothetical protein